MGSPGQDDVAATVTTVYDGAPGTAPARRVGVPKPGDRIGRYVIEEVLGQGGMGVVVAARDPGLSRAVALKIVRPELGDPSYRARLVREARAMAQLEHPAVVHVYDAGDEDGELFIAMELIRGETLGRWLAGGPRPWHEVVARFLAAGRGLAAAHRAGLVHRDFKPENVLVRASDGRVCVTDFGLAIPATEPRAAEAIAPASAPITGDEQTSPGAPAGITRTGAAIGTPAYMAPEQHRGDDVDARADIFGFCVSLYEGLYGKRPFVVDGSGPAAWMVAIDRGPTPPPAGHDVPRAVERAVLRGLASEPAARWATMDDLLRALEHAARRRGWRVGAIVGGGVIAAGAVTAFALAGRGDPTTPAAVATSPADAAPTVSEADTAATRALTSLGGCPDGPAYVDEHTVAFALDKGDAVDLWTVDDRGGEPHQLTSAPTWEWRASPGRRPGEVVYLETQPAGDQRSVVVARDVATGAETARIDTFAFAVTAHGDAIYYAGNHDAQIRRRVGDRDDAFVSLGAGLDAQQLAISPAGDRFAFIVSMDENRPQRLCTVAPSEAPSCTDAGIASGRPSFGADGASVYYGATGGVWRRDVASGAIREVISGVTASVGVAVSSDGGRLVYSDCERHSVLADVTHPEVALADDDAPVDVTAGPGGLLAWVHDAHHGTSLMLRRKDGTIIEVVPSTFGTVRSPGFDADGRTIVFASTGAHVGLYTVNIARDLQVSQLTNGADDQVPLWTRGGKVVFRRNDENHSPHVFIVDTAGGVAQQAFPTSLGSLTANLATGEILLAKSDGGAVWWDPATGKRGAEVPAPADTANVVVSPNGRWLLFQRGAFGLTLSRAPVDHPTALEDIAKFAADYTIGSATIDDDGRVIATPGRWRGELHLVPARAGARY